MSQGFKFAEYSVRKATAADHESIVQWIMCDPDHRGRVAPEFFYTDEPGIESMVLEKNGEICFFFRLSRALRIDIQFAPSETRQEKVRTGRALDDGLNWLMGMAQDAGHRQIIFESSVEHLIEFCEKRLKFQRSKNELVRHLAPATDEQSQDNPARG
jgi:hypothetical protein